MVNHLLAPVARCSVLQEVLALEEPHERDQVIIQDFVVAFPVHCSVVGEEVQISPPLLATEASPDHDRGGMLDGGDGVALLVAAHAGWPLDFCAPGVDGPEGGLIRKHSPCQSFSVQ